MPVQYTTDLPANARSTRANLTDQRFNFLVAQRLVGRTAQGAYVWECKCDCGSSTTATVHSLRSGHTSSCGCKFREMAKTVNTTHGQSKTRLYKAWAAMRDRCRNPSNPHYKNYGGRGIKVCDRWEDFSSFVEDVGHPPGPGYTLDRRDNDGGYCKENCRWATKSEQQRNRRTNRKITFNGKTHNLVEWGEITGLGYDTVHGRIDKLGWSPEKAFTTPKK